MMLDLPVNQQVVRYLRQGAIPNPPTQKRGDVWTPSGWTPSGWAPSGWAMRTHPDLAERLNLQLPHCPGAAAAEVYGVAVLHYQQVLFAVAWSMQRFILRLSEVDQKTALAEGFQEDAMLAAPWFSMDAWQSQRQNVDAAAFLQRWFATAFRGVTSANTTTI